MLILDGYMMLNMISGIIFWKASTELAGFSQEATGIIWTMERWLLMNRPMK